MKTIILGAAGFIGRNLAEKLAKKEGDPITLVDRNGDVLREMKGQKGSRIQIKEMDLVRQENYDEVLLGQDVVYHLISTTVPTTSNQQIPQEISDNVELTSRLLESCVRCGVKKVVYLSSGGTVYGMNQVCPLREGMETNPINSYGVQKLLYLYQYLYGLDYRIIRLSNPFGPYQRPNGILGAVTTFTYKALKGEEIVVYGDGSVVRDYIYIEDAVKAILNIADDEGEDRLYNVGSGMGTSLCQLLKIIEDTLGLTLKIRYVPGRAVDVPVNYLDISRYEMKFGRFDVLSLPEGIRRTADFMMREYLSCG